MNTTKILTQEQIEELKSYSSWEYRDEKFPFILSDLSAEKFSEFTGYDLIKLRELTEKTVGWEIAYCKPGVFSDVPTSYSLHFIVFVEGGEWVTGFSNISDVDFLGLYEKEKQEEPDTVENFFNDNLGEVVQKIKNTYPDVYNAIKNEEGNNFNLEATLQNAVDNLGEHEVGSFISDNFSGVYDVIRDVILDNLDSNDVPDWLKEDIGKAWCEENPEDAWGIAFDCMDSSDIKDRIIEYLDANL